MEKNELLNELRIDRSRDESSGGRGPLIAVGVALGALALGLVAWLALRPAAAEVQVATARALTSAPANASVLDASGYVTARRQATVSAKITGKVEEVLIEEGMTVTDGQILATLEDTEARAQLELVRAQHGAAVSQVAEIEALLRQAERDFARQNEMMERKLGSMAALDAARAQADTLKARLASAKRSVEVAAQSVNVYAVQLDNTIVRAPFAGVVTVKAAQPGEMISPISAGGGFTRTGIGTIVDMESLEVQVDVNESYINRVKPGQPVEAVLNAYPDWKIPASVIAIIPAADRSKATVKVRIKLEQRDERVVPDMGVRVAFLEAKVAQEPQAAPVAAGVLIPGSALRRDGESDVVFVVREGKLERRAVTLGGSIGEDRVVKAGLRAGERVVVAGPESLADGQAVEVRT